MEPPIDELAEYEVMLINFLIIIYFNLSITA